jgi:ferric-dicitrate binding protein FerR (iron transport regulator)
MENFECNTLEDLLSNRWFREWALAREKNPDGFWEGWVLAHPEKAVIVESARNIIQVLYAEFEGVSQDAIEGEVQKALMSIDSGLVLDLEDEQEDLDTEPAEEAGDIAIHRIRYWLMAAAVVPILIAGWWLLNDRAAHLAGSGDGYLSYSRPAKGVMERVNTGDTTQLVVMPDSSRVLLEPGTRIGYSQDFNKEKREIFLSGNAFFDVRKDVARPFFVYTNGLVTKVLGTSFRIRAYSNDLKATVTVISGKVSVYRATDAGKKGKAASHAGTGAIVVTPNQTLVFSKDNDQLSKILIDHPAVVAAQVKGSFNFFRTPVKEVFRLLQETYNIPVLYDEETLSGCSITANIENENFYKKLDLICSAIDASYEVADGQIVITSKGCK